ncbi:hypothetical protein M9458_051949, partial [Cirrhinus mrigala]
NDSQNPPARISVILNCALAYAIDTWDLDEVDNDNAALTAASGSGDWSACQELEAFHSEVCEPPAPIDEELVKS